MTSGSVKEWKKKVGDTVKKGEILFVVATDKLTVDSESPADGVLLAITVKEGVDVPVGGTIGYLGAAGEAVPAEATGSPAAPESPKAASAAATPRPVGAPAPAAQAPASGPVAASPKAKRMAREKGMDLFSIVSVLTTSFLKADSHGAATATASATGPMPRPCAVPPSRAPRQLQTRVPTATMTPDATRVSAAAEARPKGWRKVWDAGFKVRSAAYVASAHNDAARPLADGLRPQMR